MEKIDINLTVQEAGVIMQALQVVDPSGIFTAGISAKIRASAQKVKAQKEKKRKGKK